MVITWDKKIILEKILVSENKLSDIEFERLKRLLVDIKNIITGSNNITLRKVNNKPYGYDKMYMDKDLMEDEWIN